MALTFWQRMRVALRGWSRRRDDDAKRKQEEFLRANTSWGKNASAAAIPPGVCRVDVPSPKAAVDLEGLQAAFLDSSGAIAYYLDVESGEVVERAATEAALPAPRYRRAPTRTLQSDAEDRVAFTASMEDPGVRQSLAAAKDASAFRQALAADRTAERSWYSFKNDRATSAIESWLRDLGLR